MAAQTQYSSMHANACRRVWHLFALIIIYLACLMAISGFAWAAPAVQGVDYASANPLSLKAAGEVSDGPTEALVRVVEVKGDKGDTIFATVKDGERVIAKNLPYTLGQDGAQDADAWYGIVALDIYAFDATKLANGGYSVAIYPDRKSVAGTELYSGVIYGVYADIDGDGAGDRLIGTRTMNDSESTRGFNPPSAIYIEGATYTTDGVNVGADGTYIYRYAESSALVEGVVHYVCYDPDTKESTEVKTVAVQIPADDTRDVAIDDVVVADDGSRYRSIFSQDSVTLQNPGAMSFTVYCAKLPRDDQYDYTATIKMVSGDELIATDKVDVKGAYTYTVPTTIYKTEIVDGVEAVVAYTVDGDEILDLTQRPDDDVFTVNYARQDPESAQVQVTFNQLDGTRDPATGERLLGVQTETVDKDAPSATPAASVVQGGTTYNIAGSPSDYAYTYRSGAMPVIDVYYTPEGYTPEGAYTVTVRCVNYANSEVLQTLKFESSPDDQGAITLDTDEQIQTGSDTFVRLAGQASIQHSYYSGQRVYTVYYRNADDKLDASVGRVRVVYDQTTVTNRPTTAGGTAAATNAQMNQGGTYTTIGGANGNGTLINDRGQDTATERIGDDTTPLGQFDTGQEAASEPGLNAGTIAGIAIAVVAAGALIALLLNKRRNDDEINA